MTLRPLALLAFSAAALCTATLGAGSALAQSRPQTPAPRTGVAAPPSAVGTIPTGQGQTRGGEDFVNVDSSNRDHIDQDAQREIPGAAGFPTNPGRPVNGVGGTGGGRYSFPGGRVINNSESEAPIAAPGAPGAGGDQAGPAEAAISTTRSNIKRPSLAEATPAPPVTPAPIPPR